MESQKHPDTTGNPEATENPGFPEIPEDAVPAVTPEEEDWLDGILDAPDAGMELGPDEHAIQNAGLSHPSGQDTAGASDASTQQEAPFLDEEYRDTFGDGDALAEVFDDAAPEDTASEPDAVQGSEAGELPEAGSAPPRKRRPSRKKGYGMLGIPHILATFIWLAIILAIGVSLGRTIWVCAADVLAFGRADEEVVFTVTPGDDLTTIAGNLKKAGLIRYPELFKSFAGLMHAEDSISSGTFTLNKKYDYHALVNAMSPWAEGRETVEVVIPEGFTCAQVFATLEEHNVCPAADLENYAANGELSDYWFLEDVPRGSKYCLEGYLFPDTYEFYTHDEPQQVLEKLLDNFDYRVSTETDKNDLTLRDKLETLNEYLATKMANVGYGEDYIQENLFTIRDVVIVASMIEKETAGKSESATIASVIYNRLTNQMEYPFLNIDATIVYALGGKDGPLTAEDLQIDSPYNTYTHAGMIPGPIANPGRDSIRAALLPDDTGYLYYALDPDTGVHHFSETSSEHEAFLASISDGE